MSENNEDSKSVNDAANFSYTKIENSNEKKKDWLRKNSTRRISKSSNNFNYNHLKSSDEEPGVSLLDKSKKSFENSIGRDNKTSLFSFNKTKTSKVGKSKSLRDTEQLVNESTEEKLKEKNENLRLSGLLEDNRNTSTDFSAEEAMSESSTSDISQGSDEKIKLDANKSDKILKRSLSSKKHSTKSYQTLNVSSELDSEEEGRKSDKNKSETVSKKSSNDQRLSTRAVSEADQDEDQNDDKIQSKDQDEEIGREPKSDSAKSDSAKSDLNKSDSNKSDKTKNTVSSKSWSIKSHQQSGIKSKVSSASNQKLDEESKSDINRSDKVSTKSDQKSVSNKNSDRQGDRKPSRNLNLTTYSNLDKNKLDKTSKTSSSSKKVSTELNQKLELTSESDEEPDKEPDEEPDKEPDEESILSSNESDKDLERPFSSKKLSGSLASVESLEGITRTSSELANSVASPKSQDKSVKSADLVKKENKCRKKRRKKSKMLAFMKSMREQSQNYFIKKKKNTRKPLCRIMVHPFFHKRKGLYRREKQELEERSARERLKYVLLEDPVFFEFRDKQVKTGITLGDTIRLMLGNKMVLLMIHHLTRKDSVAADVRIWWNFIDNLKTFHKFNENHHLKYLHKQVNSECKFRRVNNSQKTVHNKNKLYFSGDAGYLDGRDYLKRCENKVQRLDAFDEQRKDYEDKKDYLLKLLSNILERINNRSNSNHILVDIKKLEKQICGKIQTD